MDNREHLETTLTALDTAIDMADHLITDGYKLSAAERLEARRDIRLLRNYARYERQRLEECEVVGK